MEVLQDLVKIPLAVVFALMLIWVLIRAIPLRIGSTGFKYVYVDENKVVRELNEEERSYLNTNFSGADGARPYLKSHFWSKAPDKKVNGYLRRNQVPWWIEISPSK